MREKIKDITKDMLIIGYAVTYLVFFFNIIFYGNATWTETGFVLYGEAITFLLLLLIGMFWLIQDIRK